MVESSDYTVLDHIDDIQVPGNVFANPVNEYWALVCLRQGLNYLYRQVSHYDNVLRQQVTSGGKELVALVGNSSAFADVPMALLSCTFHWYAISACQYVRSVGAIAYRQDSSRPMPARYTENVIPEVLVFRDKVAAHFAGMTMNPRDNEAEQLASIMPQLAFVDDSFCVGAYTVTVKRSDGVSSSTSIQKWSIKEVHERLQHRYWPDQI
ncbi:MAG: hypothetical protein ACE5Q6_17330 [Dehalococcoidia bacterium]